RADRHGARGRERAAPRAADAARPPHAGPPAQRGLSGLLLARLPARRPRGAALVRGEQRADRRRQGEARGAGSAPGRPAPFRCRRALAVALVLGVGTRGSLAQEPRRSPEPEQPGQQKSTLQTPPFAGSFEGSATLSNDDPSTACRYEGTPGTPSVHLE